MDWKKLVEDHHKWVHSSGEYELASGQPAPRDEIDSVSAELNFTFPTEFIEFYSVMNGFGIHSTDYGTEWFFLQLRAILETQDHTKEMLETHPEFGDRFVPIVDWMCGDYMGYLKPNGEKQDFRLFMLEHEKFKFDSAQDPNEFIFPIYSSIEDFLAARE